MTVRDVGDGVYECEYVPRVPGSYQVSITWGGYAIPRRSVASAGVLAGESEWGGFVQGEGWCTSPAPHCPSNPPSPFETQISPWGWGVLGHVGVCVGYKPSLIPPTYLRCRCPPRGGRCLGGLGVQLCAGVV